MLKKFFFQDHEQSNKKKQALSETYRKVGFCASKPQAKRFNRGGVEDTRLEAKDTKKIRGQGQGQPFRGQTLSRPRTGMLEAKDQGHKRKCSPKKKKKKKVFKIIFQRSPAKNVFQKNFFRRSRKFQQFKKSAVLEPRTGQFWRT